MAASVKPWEEICVRSWQHFDEVVSALPENQWVFRGHSNAAWQVNTSLYRTFEDAQPLIKPISGHARRFARDEHEKRLLDRFRRSAHLYLSALPRADEHLEWFSIMQHYGAPTRLLDVTLSPHVASYFAMESGHRESAVYAFDHIALRPSGAKLLDLHEKLFSNLKGHDAFIALFRPRMTTNRLLAQQGLFLIPSNNYEDFAILLASRLRRKPICKKIVIPVSLRFLGIERLRRMGITSTALFPGIDGFCRSLRFQILERTQLQKLLE